MPIYTWMTSTFAMAIYLYGTRTFQGITQTYVEPVKVYAATGYVNGEPTPNFAGFTIEQINNALDQGWITQQEYDGTIVLQQQGG